MYFKRKYSKLLTPTIRNSILVILSLIIVLLHTIQKQQQKELLHYQEAFKIEKIFTAKKEERIFSMLLKLMENESYFSSNQLMDSLYSLHHQKTLDDFRFQLAQNINLPFIDGFQPSLDSVYDSLMLDQSKIELWHFLQKKVKKIQQRLLAEKMLFYQRDSPFKDSVSFRLIPISYEKKILPSILSFDNKEIEVTSFPIPYKPQMKKLKFTITNPLLKRQNTYSDEVY